MKQLSKPIVLTSICTLSGFLCLLLRQWLFTTGLDLRGLPVLSHPGNILSWCVTGAVALLMVLLFFTWDKHVTCAFPLTPVSGTATLLLSAAYAIIAWQMLTGEAALLNLITGILALCSLLCSLLIAMGQFRGQRMHPLLYCPGVLFFLCYLIHSYAGWSGEPGHQLFVFQMVASVCMMVAVFCRAELAAGKVNGRNYVIFSRCAIFMNLAAVAHSDRPALYLLFAVTFLLDGCSTHKKEPKESETADAPPQGENHA